MTGCACARPTARLAQFGKITFSAYGRGNIAKGGIGLWDIRQFEMGGINRVGSIFLAATVLNNTRITGVLRAWRLRGLSLWRW